MTKLLRDTEIELMDVRQVAKCYGITPNTVWRWCREGVLPKPAKFGGATKWSRRQIIENINSRFEQGE
ncbi:helix-turn-helix domain-containing protein [Alphaproteobacteria bacterium]|nr:helix-turn-helix domain-containing protein [Alphaproteobacteria bacterium]